MSLQNLHHLPVESALNLLEAFSCQDSKSVDSSAEKIQLRQALLLLSSLSDYQNFGVCADTAIEGFLALETYLTALGYVANINHLDSDLSGSPVYIKYNTQKQSCYLDSYTGKYRGVLISCQSSQAELISGTYGHFPLDLFLSKD